MGGRLALPPLAPAPTIGSTAVHAPTAVLAAHAETRALMDLFHRRSAEPDRLPVDPLVASNVLLVPECVRDTVNKNTFPISASSPPRLNKLQREYSKVIDDAKLDSLNLDQDATIRTTSCGARGASLHLVGPVTHDDHLPDFFMVPEVFATAIRLRLGLEVRTIADVCAGCGKHDADTLGHASLKCMKCGHRTRAHNALRDTLADICRTCMLSPKLEVEENEP